MAGPILRVAAEVALFLIGGIFATVGRCRLTVSKPVLKAPMFSALQIII
jgi:hypothetical protein